MFFRSLPFLAAIMVFQLVFNALPSEKVLGSAAKAPSAQAVEADKLFRHGLKQLDEGAYEDALVYLGRALDSYRRAGDRNGEGQTLKNQRVWKKMLQRDRKKTQRIRLCSKN